MCASSITGTCSSPSLRAASTRPCPAMMPLAPSTSTGFVQPNSRMLAAICATWASEWVRGLRAYGISSPSGRQAICRSSIVQNLTNGQEPRCCCGQEFSDSAAERAGYPPPEFCGHTQRAGHRSLSRRMAEIGGPLPIGPWPSVASAPAALARGLGIVAPLAQRSPIRLVPEQLLVTSVRHDMVDHRRRLDPLCRRAPYAQRVASEIPPPRPAPAGAIAPARCARTPPLQLRLDRRRALCTPSGRCTGGFEGNGDSDNTKPAAAMPGGLSFTRGRRARRPDLV